MLFLHPSIKALAPWLSVGVSHPLDRSLPPGPPLSPAPGCQHARQSKLSFPPTWPLYWLLNGEQPDSTFVYTKEWDRDLGLQRGGGPFTGEERRRCLVIRCCPAIQRGHSDKRNVPVDEPSRRSSPPKCPTETHSSTELLTRSQVWNIHPPWPYPPHLLPGGYQGKDFKQDSLSLCLSVSVSVSLSPSHFPPSPAHRPQRFSCLLLPWAEMFTRVSTTIWWTSRKIVFPIPQ